MTRRISTYPGFIDVLFPVFWTGPDAQGSQQEDDNWRQVQGRRAPGWSERRRYRYRRDVG